MFFGDHGCWKIIVIGSSFFHSIPWYD